MLRILTVIGVFVCFYLSPLNALHIGDDIVGTWEYTVSDVEPEYAAGEIEIKKEGEDYTAVLKLSSGDIPISEMEVMGDQIKFEVYVDGSDVSVTMNFKGDKLTGQAESYDGSFTIEGKRKS